MQCVKPKELGKIKTDYVRTIIESAEFLKEFKNKDEFLRFCNIEKEKDKYSLPKYIKQKIYGFGFALSLDFLKEIGFECYAKPDVHIKNFIWLISKKIIPLHSLCMVGVAQLVRALVCGTKGRGFEPHFPP